MKIYKLNVHFYGGLGEDWEDFYFVSLLLAEKYREKIRSDYKTNDPVFTITAIEVKEEEGGK